MSATLLNTSLTEIGFASALIGVSNYALGATTLPVALALGIITPVAGNVVNALANQVTPLRDRLNPDDMKHAAWMAAAALTGAVAGTYGLPISAASAFNLMLLALSGAQFLVPGSYYLQAAPTVLMTLRAPLFKMSMVTTFIFANISTRVLVRALLDVKLIDQARRSGQLQDLTFGDVQKVTLLGIGVAFVGFPVTAAILSAATPFVVTPLAGVGLAVAGLVEVIIFILDGEKRRNVTSAVISLALRSEYRIIFKIGLFCLELCDEVCEKFDFEWKVLSTQQEHLLEILQRCIEYGETDNFQAVLSNGATGNLRAVLSECSEDILFRMLKDIEIGSYVLNALRGLSDELDNKMKAFISKIDRGDCDTLTHFLPLLDSEEVVRVAGKTH